ncbi:uncharacterized protein JCM10292_005209 [Rhodotorula paludigena]|uniref:uncharacterized protein n=1 Tax=Rhodotorula paludigena TaxID=86838 RepID=UPI00316E39AA
MSKFTVGKFTFAAGKTDKLRAKLVQTAPQLAAPALVQPAAPAVGQPQPPVASARQQAEQAQRQNAQVLADAWTSPRFDSSQKWVEDAAKAPKQIFTIVIIQVDKRVAVNVYLGSYDAQHPPDRPHFSAWLCQRAHAGWSLYRTRGSQQSSAYGVKDTLSEAEEGAVKYVAALEEEDGLPLFRHLDKLPLDPQGLRGYAKNEYPTIDEVINYVFKSDGVYIMPSTADVLETISTRIKALG